MMQNNLPCAYASKSLTETQIEKEMLAIVYRCTKFHKYLYGQEFVVQTEYKALVAIFNKELTSCPARLQRMLIQKYQINLRYIPAQIKGLSVIPGRYMYIADTLSRACESSDDEIDEIRF